MCPCRPCFTKGRRLAVLGGRAVQASCATTFARVPRPACRKPLRPERVGGLRGCPCTRGSAGTRAQGQACGQCDRLLLLENGAYFCMAGFPFLFMLTNPTISVSWAGGRMSCFLTWAWGRTPLKTPFPVTIFSIKVVLLVSKGRTIGDQAVLTAG